MIDIAQKYTDVLKLRFANIVYDEKYKFFNNGYADGYQPSETTWNKHEFVSIHNGEVIGYISYCINRNEYDVSGLCAVNFTNNKIAFGIDLMRVVKNIFEKFNFRKLDFGVYVGNPIEKSYDKTVEKYGGRIVGVKREYTRLSDGKFYDFKMYEIFKRDYENKITIK